jgi:hypothetical protein
MRFAGRSLVIPRTVNSVAACLLGLAVSGSVGTAQNNTGELRLSVTDPSGSPLGATVNILSEATKTRQSVELRETGRYSFRNLPFGDYLVAVTAAGFSPRSDLIHIHSVVPQSLTVRMSLQPVRTALEVTAAATLVDPSRTAVAYDTGSQEIAERPMGVPGRGLIGLAAMQPGWTLEANGILHPRESEYDAQFVVNGFPVEDNRSAAFARPIEADEVVSMKQYTSGIPAEFGDKLGGVIELDTTRNTSPGFHGVFIAQGGSFDTLSSYLLGQFVRGANTVSASGEGFRTDRYLDPPTLDNFSNHASSSSFNGSLDHDFSASDRLRVSILNQQTWLEVPNDLLQAAARQRQDRTSASTEGQVSWEHVFSPSLLGSVRASVRDVGANLWSNPLSTPILASQERNYREDYWDLSLAGHAGFNDWKLGTQGRHAGASEKFAYNIVTYDIDGQPIFDHDTPPSFAFAGHKADNEQAAYGQDVLHLRNLTLSLGLRFDDYSFVVKATGWSPRAGAAYDIKPLGLVIHASYDRTFGTPPFENLLVSSAPETRFGHGVYLPLDPSRGNYYEVGFTKGLGGHVRLECNWFRRDVTNFEDDDLLVNTGVSFPIAYHSATVRGTEVKVEVPRWGRFSGFLGYANMMGIARLPISGGLFLDQDSVDKLNATDRFPVSQDIRNAVSGYFRCQLLPRLWTAWSAAYTSGLPVEDVGDLPDTAFLVAQYGQSVVNRVNFERGRVHPDFALNASIGVDVLRKERRTMTLQADVTNVTDRLNLINFAGLLSGTAVGVPRSASARLRLDF